MVMEEEMTEKQPSNLPNPLLPPSTRIEQKRKIVITLLGFFLFVYI